MSSFRLIFNRQSLAYFIAAAAILLAAFIPAMAMAADVSERSIELSSSSKGATAVTATVKFKASGAAGAFVLDFCNESPIYGATCTAPVGLDVDGATSATTNFTDVNPTNAGPNNQVVVAKATSIAANENVTVVLTGISNPTAAATIYARIVTFDTKAHALDYVSVGTAQTGKVDNGGIVIPIIDSVAVSGAVLESMTFCVSNTEITGDACSAGVNAPTLELGEDPGTGIKSLVAGQINEGDIWTQITTNAAGGAVINLKSSATGCGGLINSSKPTDCYIKPVLTTGINTTTDTDAKFGVKLNTPSGTGVLQAATGSGYSTSAYALNYAADNLSGVTSTYGDPFLNTNNLPASNMNMKLTFGATVLPNTPAGTYSADLGLIATGKF